MKQTFCLRYYSIGNYFNFKNSEFRQQLMQIIPQKYISFFLLLQIKFDDVLIKPLTCPTWSYFLLRINNGD